MGINVIVLPTGEHVLKAPLKLNDTPTPAVIVTPAANVAAGVMQIEVPPDAAADRVKGPIVMGEMTAPANVTGTLRLRMVPTGKHTPAGKAKQALTVVGVTPPTPTMTPPTNAVEHKVKVAPLKDAPNPQGPQVEEITRETVTV